MIGAIGARSTSACHSRSASSTTVRHRSRSLPSVAPGRRDARAAASAAVGAHGHCAAAPPRGDQRSACRSRAGSSRRENAPRFRGARSRRPAVVPVRHLGVLPARRRDRLRPGWSSTADCGGRVAAWRRPVARPAGRWSTDWQPPSHRGPIAGRPSATGGLPNMTFSCSIDELRAKVDDALDDRSGAGDLPGPARRLHRPRHLRARDAVHLRGQLDLPGPREPAAEQRRLPDGEHGPPAGRAHPRPATASCTR